jgi:hypothetical protein
MIAASSLAVSLVALRLTKEQARAYLFPVPAIFADSTRRAIVLRNFGAGAMLNVLADLTLHSPMEAPLRIQRHVASLGQGDHEELVSAHILQPMALSAIDVILTYENIKRQPVEERFHLFADQLASLEQ